MKDCLRVFHSRAGMSDLEQYDGPLDLLLDLIRRQQIDIRDIPIATITSQYLPIRARPRDGPHIGAGLSSWRRPLIHIKSRIAAAHGIPRCAK